MLELSSIGYNIDEPEITIYGKTGQDEVYSSVGQSASLTQMRSQVRALFRPFIALSSVFFPVLHAIDPIVKSFIDNTPSLLLRN